MVEYPTASLMMNGPLHILRADDGNRTRVASLEDWGSTIELHPRSVGESSSFPGGSPAEMIETPASNDEGHPGLRAARKSVRPTGRPSEG